MGVKTADSTSTATRSTILTKAKTPSKNLAQGRTAEIAIAARVGDSAPTRKPRTKKPTVAPAASPTKLIGETLAADLEDPHRKRGTYALFGRAISIALDVPYDAMRVACMTAVRDLSNNDDRIRSRAREFLFKVQDSGITAAQGLDRIQRLDDGTATENVAIAAITPEALAAVAATLRRSSFSA